MILNSDNLGTLPKPVVYGFFILGIISAVSFRVLIVFQYYEKSLMRLVWYIGIIGYFLFFLYRYLISHKRKKVIDNYELLAKLEKGEKITDKDREALYYVVKSIDKSKENYNYYLIFILSVIAICFDIVMSI